MIKQLFTILICLYAVSTSAQDVWVRKDSVNGPPRSSCAAFVLKGEAFVVGGLGVTSFKRKMYSYDVDQDDWDSEESLGGENGDGLERGGAIGFKILGKGYIGLGQGNTVAYFSDFWEYNPQTKAWTQKANFIGSARRQAVGFAIDSFGYVGTGQDASGVTKDFYKYEATSNTWTQLADFAGTARKGAVGFSNGGQGYLTTGDDGTYTNDFWIYRIETDTWEQKSNFPGTPRTGAVGWGVFPQIFIACGYDNTLSYKKDVWEYNYFGDQWVQRSDFMGSARTNAIAVNIDGIGYIGLGYDGGFLDDFYAYTPILSDNLKDNLSAFFIYPNPTSDFIQINGLPQAGKYHLSIFDLNGKTCYETNFNSPSKTVQLDGLNLSTGTYICKVNNHSHQFQTKLIIY
ncbi:MAG: T9SS type A sorting domain-containing protein [Crocinitomicaceae bacterium]